MSSKTAKKIFYWVPRVVSLAFVIFLSLFALDVFGEYSGVELLVALLMHLVPSLVLLLVVFLAWKNELLGGILFLCFALVYVVAVGLDKHWSWYVGISGPLLLIGSLFLMSYAIDIKHKRKK